MRSISYPWHCFFLIGLVCGIPSGAMAQTWLTLGTSQTVSAPTGQGWRVVESLRITGTGIHKASVEKASETSRGIRVRLAEDYAYMVQPVNQVSSIFRSVQVQERGDGQGLEIQFVSTASKRHCIFDSLTDVLFIVCTQQFESESAVQSVPVHVTPLDMQRAPDLMAVKRRSSAFTADRDVDERVVAASDSTQPAILHEPLYAFAPLPQQALIPNAPALSDVSISSASLAPARRLSRSPSEKVVGDDRAAPARLPVVAAARATPAVRGEVIDSGSRQLQTVRFDLASGQLELRFSASPRFHMLRNSPQTYRITISEASAAHPGLFRPFFAPMDFPAVSLIRTEQKGEGLQMTVQVARNASLQAVRRDNSLILRVR